MSLKSAIYEHLKTRKKYNTLENRYTILKEDYERKVYEFEEYKRQNKIIRDTWEQRLKEQEEKIIKLKKKEVR